jgi:hypothetical protein
MKRDHANVRRVKVSELGLGDIIHLSNEGYAGYMTATVYRKDENGDCHVRRPYVHTGDVVYSGPSLISYIGIEDFILPAIGEVTLIRRNTDTLK